ncbi:MAG TPA: hypothetical protein VFI06_04365 [Chitinophagaceae bacterium]|nr:hypothetical protein [Chitinophagaceae bacterium]
MLHIFMIPLAALYRAASYRGVNAPQSEMLSCRIYIFNIDPKIIALN